jgi:hypothetical protein
MLAASIAAVDFAAAPTVSAQQGGDDDVVKQVLAAWQKRRQAIKTVAYKVEGVETYVKGSMTENSPEAHPRLRKDFPPKDVSFPKRMAYAFEFSTGKVRKEQRDHILNISLGAFVPKTQYILFDGKTTKIHTPRAENTSELYTPSEAQPDLWVYPTGTHFVLDQNDYPILFAHGYPHFYNRAIDPVGYFERPLQPSVLRFHQRGAIGDRACVIVRSVQEAGKYGLFDEFWVDLERDGAILRWQAYSRGRVYIRHEIRYRQAERHWLPESWQFDLDALDDGRNQFTTGERMKVTAVQIAPGFSSSLLTVPLKQGMVVRDAYTSEGGRFVVGTDDRTLVPFGQSTQVWRWWHWLGIALLGGAMLGGLVYLLRRRMRSSV